MSPTIDPYRTLGLAPDATLDEVKRAYRRLAKLYHPDSAGGAATARFIALQRAYEALITGKGRGGAAQRPDASTMRRPAGRRPAPGSRPGAPPWQADPERARATREGGAGPRERPRRGDRAGPKARPGSTSYDGAEAEALDPEWDGATWYGTASGTYWTINPKEYADPRKHGPEYLARGRRLSSDGAEAGGVAPTGTPTGTPPGEESGGLTGATAAGEPAGEPAGDLTGATATSKPADIRAAGEPADIRAAETRSADARPAQTRVAGDRSTFADAAPRTRPGEPGAAGASPAPPTPLPERIVVALLGWLVLGLAAANVIGELSGCARFAASCPEPVGLVTILVQPLIVGLLFVMPRLAEAAALGTIAVLVAGIPAAVLLSAMGAASAPAGQAGAGLGLLLALSYLVAFVGGVSGRLRVPLVARGRVR
jgi:hypothetical protein